METNKRLTRKTNIGYFEEPIGDGEIYTHNQKLTNIDNIIQKLGQLEDIEEELGIDLVALFKALKNGCYVKSKANGIEFAQKVSFTKNQMVCKVYANGYFRQRSYKNKWLKDYGKTWALTKEELL